MQSTEQSHKALKGKTDINTPLQIRKGLYRQIQAKPLKQTNGRTERITDYICDQRSTNSLWYAT